MYQSLERESHLNSFSQKSELIDMEKNDNQESIPKKESSIIKVDPNNPQSPYFLSSSDSPSNIIYLVSLNGNNHANWSRRAINAFRSKNKLGFVNGTITKPHNFSLEVHAGEICNSW